MKKLSVFAIAALAISVANAVEVKSSNIQDLAKITKVNTSYDTYKRFNDKNTLLHLNNLLYYYNPSSGYVEIKDVVDTTFDLDGNEIEIGPDWGYDVIIQAPEFDRTVVRLGTGFGNSLVKDVGNSDHFGVNLGIQYLSDIGIYGLDLVNVNSKLDSDSKAITQKDKTLALSLYGRNITGIHETDFKINLGKSRTKLNLDYTNNNENLSALAKSSATFFDLSFKSGNNFKIFKNDNTVAYVKPYFEVGYSYNKNNDYNFNSNIVLTPAKSKKVFSSLGAEFKIYADNRISAFVAPHINYDIYRKDNNSSLIIDGKNINLSYKAKKFGYGIDSGVDVSYGNFGLALTGNIYKEGDVRTLSMNITAKYHW